MQLKNYNAISLDASPMENVSKPANDSPGNGDRPHVLIIEDNRDLARLFGDLVEILGCTVDIAWGGKSGLQLAVARKPDIVFCDITMPGEKNGLDVAREIRANPSLADTWLVAVTGSDDPETRDLARGAGFGQLFAKPIKFAQLQGVLNELKAARARTSAG